MAATVFWIERSDKILAGSSLGIATCASSHYKCCFVSIAMLQTRRMASRVGLGAS